MGIYFFQLVNYHEGIKEVSAIVLQGEGLVCVGILRRGNVFVEYVIVATIQAQAFCVRKGVARI